jgi:hypothetical protein
MDSDSAARGVWPRHSSCAVDANGRRLDEATAIGQGTGMYFAHISLTGPANYRDVPLSFGVLEAVGSPKPIGMAMGRGWDATCVAWRSLKARGKALPVLWVIIDRQFRPAQ